MLATATAPANVPRGAWNDGPAEDGLEEDVAVFSYEGALKHAASDASKEDARRSEGSASSRLAIEEADIFPAQQQPPPGTHDPMSARVTIRLSRSECEQLRARAAESGMTLSAYLRSCTLEVENLRSQVKSAVAQLRLATEEKKPPATEPTTENHGSWLARLWTRGNDRAAQA
jgi:predicted DNA binding CopG/RHH family protein